jgi:hypothetical protein
MKSLVALIAGYLLAVQAIAAPVANEPKQIASQWYEAFARHDAGLLEKILAPSWVDIPSPPDAPHGPEAAKAAMAMLASAFPDFDIRIEDIIQDGNKVVVRSAITERSSKLLPVCPTNAMNVKRNGRQSMKCEACDDTAWACETHEADQRLRRQHRQAGGHAATLGSASHVFVFRQDS